MTCVPKGPIGLQPSRSTPSRSDNAAFALAVSGSRNHRGPLPQAHRAGQRHPPDPTPSSPPRPGGPHLRHLPRACDKVYAENSGLRVRAWHVCGFYTIVGRQGLMLLNPWGTILTRASCTALSRSAACWGSWYGMGVRVHAACILRFRSLRKISGLWVRVMGNPRIAALRSCSASSWSTPGVAAARSAARSRSKASGAQPARAAGHAPLAQFRRARRACAPSGLRPLAVKCSCTWAWLSATL